jgi:hypothetical protein
MVEPVDIERRLADPHTYEETILWIFAKKRQRGLSFDDAGDGVTYFDTVTKRRALSRVIARNVADGTYRPQPVALWELETNGKHRAAHMPEFVDHVVGSALFQLVSQNARCYGLPGVYSYLPGTTNVAAMRALAGYVRTHRVGAKAPPVYVLQSDFEHYGDNLPVGPNAALWGILREADARIDALLGKLGVARKLQKECRTALSGNGMPSTEDPAYVGGNRIDSLGLSVTHIGTLSLAPHRLRRFVGRIATRLDGAAPALAGLATIDRARELVAATNVMLDVTNPFAVSGLVSLLDTTTDRDALKDLDFRVARKIVQVATGRPGVRGFRLIAPAVLYRDMGLASLVNLRNLR